MTSSATGPTPAGAYDDDARISSDRVVITRAWAMLSPYQARLWVSLALILVASAAGLVQPRIIQFSIDRGLVEGHLDELNLWALAYVATLVIGWLASYWQTWLLSWVGQRILFTLRTRMFDHLQKLSLRYYDRERIGHIISRNTSDVSAVNEVLTQGLLQSIADAFTLVGTVALMLTMSVRQIGIAHV